MAVDKFLCPLSLCRAAIQSVMSSGDALTPGKTGGVGSAIFNLHDNGTLDYQVPKHQFIQLLVAKSRLVSSWIREEEGNH